MTYRQRLSLFILVDSIIVLTAIFVSKMLTSATIQVITLPVIISSITMLISHQIFSLKLKLYKKAWEYASIGELLIIFKVVSYSVLTGVIMQQIVLHEVRFRLLAVTWLLHLILIGGSRFVWRIYRDTFISKVDNRKRTLVVGAGAAGTMVARQLLKNDGDLVPVAFIDDNVRKQKLDILGIPVMGGVDRIERVVGKLDIEHIIIAIPSLSKRELNPILQECVKTKAKTQTLPMLESGDGKNFSQSV